MSLDWLEQTISEPDNNIRQQAEARQAQLTKPPGSLGKLETIAVQLAAMQGNLQPALDKVQIVVFAADHGVAQEGVSAFPQAVTTEMVKNFARGGAAISVMAKHIKADLEVVDVGTVVEPESLPGVVSQRVAPGTANFTQQPAMTEEQLADAMQAGRDAALRARDAGVQLFIGGEMGIANTTAATALACAVLDLPVTELVGPGTGLDDKGVQHKAKVIQAALKKHVAVINKPLKALCCLGGFEIAALTGAFIACAQQAVPVLVDGFIASVAALLAMRLCPNSQQWMLFAHCSAEPGHQKVLAALNAEPILNLNMRLGEGSGAATAVPILRIAIATQNEMATFAEAGVSEG